MKSIFKKESLIMTLVLVFYGFIAGGSAEMLSESLFWKIIGILLLIIIAIAFIIDFVEKQNRKKRLGLKEEFESQEKEFNLSDKVGDDRIALYFDKNKEKVLIASISTDGIDKYYIDDFTKHIVKHSSYSCCAIDDNRRKALLVQHHNGNFKYDVQSYGSKEIASNNNIPTQLFVESLPKKVENDIIEPPTFILLEEKYGHIAISNNLSFKSFSYVSDDLIPNKEGNTAYVTEKKIGSYVFLMDEFYKVMIIISPLISSYQILNYSDIINVTYECR